MKYFMNSIRKEVSLAILVHSGIILALSFHIKIQN